MLLELTIKDLAIIDHCSIKWGSGFTAITGESGTGKSVLISAFKILSGEKTNSDLIRKGADKLSVEAIFEIPSLQEVHNILRNHEFDLADGELVLQREILTNGKSRCRINGSIVTMGLLTQISAMFFDLHGQHQQQALLQPANHLTYIDRYVGSVKLKESFQINHKKWRSLLEQLKELDKEVKDSNEKKDFYLFQYQELESAGLIPDEEAVLEKKLSVLADLEKITESFYSSLNILEDENTGLFPETGRLERTLKYLESRVDTFSGITDHITNIKNSLAEIAAQLQQYEIPEQLDDRSIDSMNSRLALLQKLKSKYKMEIPQLINLRDSRKEAISKLTDYSEHRKNLESKIQTAYSSMYKAAVKLSRKRKEAGKAFVKSVNFHLSRLNMESCEFSCEWEFNKPDVFVDSVSSSQGLDQMQFYFSSSPGETPKPFHKIISGGESSRVMLAIKTALAEADPVPLMIFDEIDVGVGGVTANRIGEAFEKLSVHHQIISITHLHQVAALASHQINVTKSLSEGRWVTKVKSLSDEERVSELARMLGDTDSDTSLDHARKIYTGKRKIND